MKDATEATKAALDVLPDPFRSMAQQMLKMCAYAGTGDVLVVQEQLQICSEHYTAVVIFCFYDLIVVNERNILFFLILVLTNRVATWENFEKSGKFLSNFKIT